MMRVEKRVLLRAPMTAVRSAARRAHSTGRSTAVRRGHSTVLLRAPMTADRSAASLDSTTAWKMGPSTWMATHSVEMSANLRHLG